MNASFQVRTIVSLLDWRRTTGTGALLLPPLILVGGGFLLVLFVLAPSYERSAAAFELSALWRDTLSGGEGQDTQNLLFQKYRASDNILLDLTDAMTANVGINYNRAQSSGGVGATEYWNPAASFGLSNDIFRLAFAGSATRNRRPETEDFDTKRWQTTLAPASYPWDRKFWPSSSVYYGETQSSSPGRVDSHAYTYGASLSWGLRGVGKLFYGYDGRRTENRRSHRESETDDQNLRFLTNGKFWKDRLKVAFSQGITHYAVTDSGVVPASGVVEELPLVNFTYFSRTATTDPNFNGLNFSLAGQENPALGNLENQTTFGIGPNQSWFLGVTPVFAPDGTQQVDQLRVYVDDPFGELANVLPALHWDLYASVDNANWDPVAGNVTANYNGIDERFELDIPELPRQYQFLMVVLSNRSSPGPGAVTVAVRAVESIPLRSGTPGKTFSNTATTTSYSTNADLSALVTPRLSLSSNFAANYSAAYFNGDIRGNLTWRFLDMIYPSLGFSESLRRDNIFGEESIYRAYSFALPVRLLPTFSVSFHVTRAEDLKNSLKISSSNRFLFSANAILYPDFTASLTESYSTGSRRGRDGTIEDADNFATSLVLKAGLTPKLNCQLTNSFQSTYKPLHMANYSSGLSLSYRPSDPLSMGLSIDKTWTGSGGDSQGFDLNMALLNTRKTRVNFAFNYSHTGTGQAQKYMSLLANWNISRIFALKSQATYAIAEGNSWNILTSLYMRL